MRLWRNYVSHLPTEMVTAWQALSDMLPSSHSSGLVIDWEQENNTLLASGDVRVIRIWDVQKELKIQVCSDILIFVLSGIFSPSNGRL